MVHIKKLVLHGFKSFAKKTEILFDKGISTVIGSNGSGKSNIADALCFVLGRLSIKSMRAAKARNLLFMGSKYVRPAREASVELVFDNSDGGFSMDGLEVSLRRTVKYNGQSVYRINGETKTRLEVIEMLAQAGIDPYGFNLILQGQIQAIVKMHPEERRKIVEEVAGIAIYESRKDKSLKELEKTEERLKDISAVLRERNAYLNNLDKERSQALRFKDLELIVKRCKLSIIQKKTQIKDKELTDIDSSIEGKAKNKDKHRMKNEELQIEISGFSDEINKITKHIQQSTGIEQESLHTWIANLRAEIEGLSVRKENYENRKSEISHRISEMEKSIPELNQEILDLKKESPLVAKKSAELKKKKEELARLEEERRKMLTKKSELNTLREQIKDRNKQIASLETSAEELIKQLEDQERALVHGNEEECEKLVVKLKGDLKEFRLEMENLNGNQIIHEKKTSVAESEINRAEKVKNDIAKIDVCPLCQNKMTQEHMSHVMQDSDDVINKSKEILEDSRNSIEQFRVKRKEILVSISESEKNISSIEVELVRHKTMKEKKDRLKHVVSNKKNTSDDLEVLEQRMKNLETQTYDMSRIEENYRGILLDIEEISSRTEEDVDTTLLFKDRELEKIKSVIEQSKRDLEEMNVRLVELEESLKTKRVSLKEKEEQDKALQERFKKLFEQREKAQNNMQERNLQLSEEQNSIRAVEEQINYLKIGRAKADAEREALAMEASEFIGIEILSGSINALEERLKKSQEALSHIGSINMRALEVYEDVKKEFDIVSDKVETLAKEKEEILGIIAEIDMKKKKSFVKTFKAMNALFSENFSKLSSKGSAYLELDNPEDIFSGGISIVVKIAKGKYFDVTSLSGGEQTLVALSLLFAIQEYKPYHFYIFDEIDAALDKRNSERLAALLQQYMKQGQYIVITHNDAIIMNSDVLYGISMHDGVSKVLSLNVNRKEGEENVPSENESNSEKPDDQNPAKVD